MAQTTGTSEDIIEKRDSNPIATACILLSFFALAGAITLQLMEIAELQKQDPKSAEALGTSRYADITQKALESWRKDVDEVLESSVIASDDVDLYDQIHGGAVKKPNLGDDAEVEEDFDLDVGGDDADTDTDTDIDADADADADADSDEDPFEDEEE